MPIQHPPSPGSSPVRYFDPVQSWLVRQGYDCVVQRHPSVPHVRLVTSFSQVEADEAAWGLNHAGIEPAKEFVDLDEFVTRVRRAYLRDLHWHLTTGTFGAFWRLVFRVFPDFGKLP